MRVAGLKTQTPSLPAKESWGGVKKIMIRTNKKAKWIKPANPMYTSGVMNLIAKIIAEQPVINYLDLHPVRGQKKITLVFFNKKT